jgi:2-C-methyl-D-erythritol 4-phosphate cytidylyltransferase
MPVVRRFAIIVAGGQGTRMNNEVPKQFIEISGKPVLVYTIESFLRAQVDVLILVIAKNHLERWASIKEQWLPKQSIQIVNGGETRFQSVKNGLKPVQGPGIVAIHDAARPCVSAQLISAGYEAAAIHKSAVASVALRDSIREKSGGTTVSRDRSNYYLIQTPQTFDIDLLKKSYETTNDTRFTDDASVVASKGHEVYLIEGFYQNIKITTDEDLDLARLFLSKDLA